MLETRFGKRGRLGIGNLVLNFCLAGLLNKWLDFVLSINVKVLTDTLNFRQKSL